MLQQNNELKARISVTTIKIVEQEISVATIKIVEQEISVATEKFFVVTKNGR